MDEASQATLDKIQAAIDPIEGKEPETEVVTETEVSEAKELKAPEAPAQPELDFSVLEDPEDVKETPSLNADQQAVLDVFQTPQQAKDAEQIIRNHSALAHTFKTGDYDGLLNTFAAFDQTAAKGLEEHFYKKFVGKADAQDPNSWVARWIREQEQPGDPRLDELQKRLDQMEAEKQSNQANMTQRQRVEQQTKIANDFHKEVTGWFDKIKFSSGDRKWVDAMFRGEIASNPEVLNAVRNGKFNTAKKLFVSVIKDYVDADKPKTQAEQQVRAAQLEKKQPLQVSAQIEEDGPSTYEDVKAGDEEGAAEVMRKQVKALFSNRK
jgi:hypothetical protein